MFAAGVTTRAAPPLAAIAPKLSVQLRSGDGHDLSIDSVEPKFFELRGLVPGPLHVVVKGKRMRDRFTLSIGGASAAKCGDVGLSDEYVCELTFSNVGQAEKLRFQVLHTLAAPGMPPLAFALGQTIYDVEIPIIRVAMMHSVAPNAGQMIKPPAGAPAPVANRSPPVAVARAPGAMEPRTNRYGGDYRGQDMATALQCRAACASEAQCKAWTWVKPGVQGTSAKCWLKSAVPAPSHDECCTSGLK